MDKVIFENKVTEGTVYQVIHFSDSLRAVKMLKHNFNRKLWPPTEVDLGAWQGEALFHATPTGDPDPKGSFIYCPASGVQGFTGGW